jgi:hypothetical protein
VRRCGVHRVLSLDGIGWILALAHDAPAVGQAAQIFEGAERFGDQAVFLVQHLAFAIGHGRRFVQHPPAGAQHADAGLHEIRLHFHRDQPRARLGQAARRAGERDIEQGHDHPAVHDVPGVQVVIGERQRHLAGPVRGVSQPDAEKFDKGTVHREYRGRAHADAPARALHMKTASGTDQTS